MRGGGVVRETPTLLTAARLDGGCQEAVGSLFLSGSYWDIIATRVGGFHIAPYSRRLSRRPEHLWENQLNRPLSPCGQQQTTYRRRHQSGAMKSRDPHIQSCHTVHSNDKNDKGYMLSYRVHPLFTLPRMYDVCISHLSLITRRFGRPRVPQTCASSPPWRFLELSYVGISRTLRPRLS